jgi:hypothetical protein
MVRRLAIYHRLPASHILEGRACDCPVALLSWRDFQLTASELIQELHAPRTLHLQRTRRPAAHLPG